jgi:hypothetical protein
MCNVTRPGGRAQGPANDEDGDEERDTIEDGAQESDGKLHLEIMSAGKSPGVLGKDGKPREPIAGQVDDLEAEEAES